MDVSNLTDGVKYDEKKIRFDLIPVESLTGLAKVYTMGAHKYDDDNWRKGMKWNRVYGAILRHLNAFWVGEDKDKESGLNHLLHAAWGCFTLYWYWIHGKGEDNRWNYGTQKKTETPKKS